MENEQLINVLKVGLAQALGDDYADQIASLSPNNPTVFTDLGKTITSSDDFSNLFVKGCIMQMGVLEIDNMVYREDEMSSLVIKRDAMPGFKARVYFEPTDNIMADPSFHLEEGKNYSELEHTYFGVKYTEKIFSKMVDILGAMSYSHEDLIQAFKSMQEMDSFLSGKRAMILSILDMKMEVIKHFLVQVGIATSIKNGNVRHLVTDFNKISGKTLTKSTALHDRDFIAYMSEEISNYKDYIRKWTSAFNNKKHVAFSTRTNTYLLKPVETRIRYGLRADTFNEKLTSFGDYETVTSWQAVTSDNGSFDIDTLSTIMLDADAVKEVGITANDSGNFTKSGIVAFMFDWRALGITIVRDYVNSAFTASASFNTEFYHNALIAYMDDNYSMLSCVLD